MQTSTGMLLLLVATGLGLISVNADETTGPEHIPNNGQTPAFRPEEMYQDLFPLTNENFTTSVLRIKDPWIVIFHDGSIDRQWKTMATQTRGTVWIGIIDVTKEKDLIEHLDYDSSLGVASVYPFGNRLHKERSWRYVKTDGEARTVALKSLPDIVQEIDGDDLQAVFTDSFMSKPSRFPAFLLLDEDETPSTFKALAVRFEKYFLFTKIVRPSPNDLKSLGLTDTNLKLPELYVMLTTGGNTESVHAVRYDAEKFGRMNYTQVMEFLFTINGQFRHGLPGANFAHEQQEAEMSDVVKIEAKRFEILYGEDGEKHIKNRAPPDTQPYQNDKIKFKVTKSTGFRDEL